MKVMCIDEKCRPDHKMFLKCGSIYTVIGESKTHCGQPTYILEEDYPACPTLCPKCGEPNSDPMYLKNRFAPLSDIDEEEFVNNKQEINETVNHRLTTTNLIRY